MMTSTNATNAASTKNSTNIDDGNWKLVCGGTLALSSEHITIAIVSNAKSRRMATTTMRMHCNAVKGVGIHPIEGVISRGGGELPCGWGLCPPLLLSMIRRIAILRMGGSLLTRGGLLSLMMALSGIEEEWDNNRIATLGTLALEVQRCSRKRWTTRAALAVGGAHKKQ
jgi:hypothetical protein